VWTSACVCATVVCSVCAPHRPCIVMFEPCHILLAERSDEVTVALDYLRVVLLHEIDEATVELTNPFRAVEYVTAVQCSAHLRVGLMGVARDDTLLVVAVSRGVLVGPLSGRAGGGR
jgi:hypothetical protein